MLKNTRITISTSLRALRGVYVCAALLMCSFGLQAQVTLLNWSISSDYLVNGGLRFEAGEVKTVTFTVELQRPFNTTTGQYSPVSGSVKLARVVVGQSAKDISTQTFPFSTNDFTGAFATKTFTVSMTAVGLSSSNIDSYVRTGDRITLIFVGNSVPPSNADSYPVAVQLWEIGGNAICCSKCVGPGEQVGLLSTRSGSSLSGGDRLYQYQWQKSTDGSNFSDIYHEGPAGINLAQNVSYNPGTISTTTWYRRVVTSSSGSSPEPIGPSVSGPVKIEFLNPLQSPTIPATTYTQDKTVKATGYMTIQGDQFPNGDIDLNFISDTQIIVAPSSIISPKTILTVGALCGTINGRVASVEPGQTANAPVEAVAEKQAAVLFEEDAIRVYPNPAQGSLQVTLDAAATANTRLIVLDKFSNVVLTTGVAEGDRTVTLNLGTLPADTYYLKVIDMNRKPSVTRFMIRN